MTHEPFRTNTGGWVDRDHKIQFNWNGEVFTGCKGDTLASALLANGRHLVARSFKYHRPRGIMTAGPEEPGALVQLGDDRARTDPNMRATQLELFEGLSASAQNCWPSLGFDIGAVNDILSPLIPAGFYYKTFMWPASLWMTYERFIRRAAGLGRCPTGPDPDRYEHRHTHTDLLIVGAGPAGLMAALAAGRAGARVILAEDSPLLGGQLLAEPTQPDLGPLIDGQPAWLWIKSVEEELAGLANVTLLPRTCIFAYHHHNMLNGLEKITDHLPESERDPAQPRQRLWKIRARQVVLATGAIERPIVFAENDRPGIMLAGATRTYLNRYGVRVGDRVAFFTNNDGAYRAALELQAAGAVVPAILDVRADADGPLVHGAREAGIDIFMGHGIVGTEGKHRIERLYSRRLPVQDGGSGEVRISVECDALGISGGWNPVLHLKSQSRGQMRWDADQATFLPDKSFQPERTVGAANGALGLEACLLEGAEGGALAARAAGYEATTPPAPAVDRDPPPGLPSPIWRVPADRPAHKVKAFVDYQNDVTAKDLDLAIREGYRSVEHVKRYTTTGMGTDQGKIGNVNALAIVAGALDSAIPAVGVTTFRPPYTPVTFGAIAGHRTGRLFDPVRTTPMHQWAVDQGAVFENVGQWKRAWYFPAQKAAGPETLREAVDREARAVRESAGILDASTLGKIDIQGPDAGEFLNRIYTNAWLKLGVGRCRYGLMLGEDGMVMDDGVTTRLADHHFHMTTTTGGAANVLNWLEEWHQTEWPDLRVYLTSVTEQWAVAAVSGPRARAIVEAVVDGVDFSPERFPHMSVADGRIGGVPVRVFRVSFTGEASFEVNIPARYGAAMWEALWAAGAGHGLTAYGTEAMHVLRAEKGFIIVGQETDGTVCPADLGMGWIVSKKKPDFVGKRSLTRADNLRPDRKQLVGLLTRDPRIVLEEGAHLVANADIPSPPVPMLGHVTSAYHSPNLGRSIALAMVKGGAERKGSRLWAAMADGAIEVDVVDPVFYDPQGDRLHD